MKSCKTTVRRKEPAELFGRDTLTCCSPIGSLPKRWNAVARVGLSTFKVALRVEVMVRFALSVAKSSGAEEDWLTRLRVKDVEILDVGSN